MSQELDTKVDDLAKKALAQLKPDVSWIWKILGGAALTLGMWWVKYQLSKKSQELAKAKTELEIQKLTAQQVAAAAAVEVSAERRDLMVKASNEAPARAAEDEKKLEEAATAHNVRWAKIKAVKENDWDTLNKMAGVQ